MTKMSFVLMLLALIVAPVYAQSCAAPAEFDVGQRQLQLITFGSAEMSLAPLPPTSTIPVTATSNANVRAEPSTNATILTSLAQGTTVTANGRLNDSTWVRIILEDERVGWIYANLITSAGDVPRLEVVTSAEATSPLIAYDLQTLNCAGGSGILIQTNGSAQSLLLNGVNLEINPAATLYVTTSEDEMVVYVLEGRARVTSQDQSQRALPGTQITVALRGNDVATTPVPYELTASTLPLDQLKRDITLAEPPSQAEIDDALGSAASRLVDDFYAAYACFSFERLSMGRRIENPLWDQITRYSGCGPVTSAAFLFLPGYARFDITDINDQTVIFTAETETAQLTDSVSAEDFSTPDNLIFGSPLVTIFLPTDGRELWIPGMVVGGVGPVSGWPLAYMSNQSIEIGGVTTEAMVYSGSWTGYFGTSYERIAITTYIHARTGLFLRTDYQSTVLECECDPAAIQTPFVEAEFSWGLVETNQPLTD